MMTARGFRCLAAIGVASLLSVPTALAASPVGIWEIEMRDSRYSVELCGAAGTALCGTLIWLGNGADSPDNLPYLNTLMIDHAPQTGPNTWKGDLHIYGQSAAGTITQVSEDQITLRGCVFGIICKTYQMYRMAD
ncbi:DUF2147 domain-containing protein [Devosia sp. BSSL-BM10]|uniref:DUF2147 domain-containing protein n=1 Tax=Devosia litorisediminis TaxID=2829817 RepID=A0A942I5C3_9HYPH|nr:DUF2147 domain-containing protein [Devosia litorisediminis]MBS3847747.1 DUF2147 domain-containing protein [Devosia litorisediminis]